MDSGPITSLRCADSRRVVVLSAENASTELPAENEFTRIVRAANAYEAAAELLSEPSDALVIDLSMFSRRHVGLLKAARRMQVETFAFGSLPAGITSDDLSGVTLISRRDLSKISEKSPNRDAVSLSPEMPQAASQRPMEPARCEPAESAASTSSGQTVKLTPRKLEERQTPAGQYMPVRPASPDLARQSPAKPDELLSREEIDALLEDQQ